MNKRIGQFMVGLLLAALLAGCGLLREPESASGPIEAVPLAVVTESATEPVAEPTAAPMEEPTVAPVEEPTAAPIEEPTAAPVEEPVAESDSAESAPAGLRLYTISQEASQVRFELDEDLRGRRITVVGVTTQVAGEIALDLADLSQTQVGIIQINARTLATDNSFRNRAIQNEILDTGAHEFITFTPTAVNGLPAAAAVGETVTFTIDGDLTIRDITQPATFTVTAQALSDSQLSGTATATVTRAAYDLRIPEVPNVANVEDEVDLIIDFVADGS